MLPGAGSSRLSKILACRCKYFRLDFYFLCDPQIGVLKIPLRDSVGAAIIRLLKRFKNSWAALEPNAARVVASCGESFASTDDTFSGVSASCDGYLDSQRAIWIRSVISCAA